MAIKDGKTSNIATATYTIIPTKGKGTAEDPFSVADALLYINNMENGATTADKYYVKGFVVGTPSIDKKPNSEEFYGNAKFYMGDTKNAESTIYAYQLKGLDNANIDKEDYIKDGDQIVTYSKLQKYVKNNVVTPELSSGYIYSIATAPTTYKITITNTEHGNITLDKTEAAEGEKVSVIGMSTDEGWEMNQPTITAENGAEVVIGGNDKEGHYFIMPASNVTIELNITKLYIITTVFDSNQGDVTGISFDSEKSPIYKKKKKKVTFTVTAKEGFKVESVTAADADNTPITVNVAEDKSYYFEMPAKDVTITAVFSVSVEDTWTVAGTQPLTYNTWDPTDTRADMTPNGNGAGVSTYERNDIVLAKGSNYEFKIVKNHAWGEEYPAQNYVITIDETAKYHVKIFFNTATKEISYEKQKTGEAGPITHTWSVIGTFVGSWDVDTDMTKGEDGLYIAKFENVAIGTYQFKVRADHDWSESYGGGDDEYGNSVVNVSSDGSTVTVTFNEEDKAVKYIVTAPTGISTAKVVDLDNAQRYNTAGQKVSKDYKGIVIVNGKKFVVK